jgi:hypothetical protein
MWYEDQLWTSTAQGGNLRRTSFVGGYRVSPLPIRPTTVTRYCRRMVTVARHRDPFFLCTGDRGDADSRRRGRDNQYHGDITR